jgi:hypothetical protein
MTREPEPIRAVHAAQDLVRAIFLKRRQAWQRGATPEELRVLDEQRAEAIQALRRAEAAAAEWAQGN